MQNFPLIVYTIFHGKLASKNEFSYQVAILLANEGIDEPVICSGAILRPSWIISTASCLTSHLKENIAVIAGENYISSWNSYKHRREILRIIVYPDYEGIRKANAAYDLGLGKLAEPFTLENSIAMVELPFEHTYPKGNAEVAGWGATNYLYMRPNNLRVNIDYALHSIFLIKIKLENVFINFRKLR